LVADYAVWQQTPFCDPLPYSATGAVKTPLDKYKFTEPPYPDTRAPVDVFRTANSPDLQYLIACITMWTLNLPSALDFVVSQKPTRAGIDPYSKLIARNPEDNVMDVVKK
jgi:hypothetical protein